MPVPNRPTIAQIQLDFIASIEAKIGQNVPILSKAFLRVFGKVLAGLLYPAYLFGYWAYLQIFTATCDDDALASKGEAYDILKSEASPAQITATETGTNGITIPAGDLYLGPNGLVYKVQVDAVIAAGVASLSLVCLTAGVESNLQPAETLNKRSPIIGVTGIATVTTLDIEGVDTEDLDDYRVRVSDREKYQPQGGAKADYIARAKATPGAGVTRAFAYRPAAGYVTVYPITDDAASRIPTAPTIALVEAYLEADDWAPLQSQISVAPITERAIAVTVTGLSPNTLAIRTAIDDNITDWIFSREPKQYNDQTELKNRITTDLLTKIAVDSGLITCTSITFTVDAVPDTDYTLADTELCTGTVAFV